MTDLIVTATEETTNAPVSPRRLQPVPTSRLWTSELLWVVLGVPAVTVLMWVAGGGVSTLLTSAGGALTAIGQLAGLIAGLAALGGLALAARPASVERRWGLDRMLGWHRWTGITAVSAVVIHLVALLMAYSMRSGMTLIEQATFLFAEPWMPAAYTGAALMLLVGLTSWRRIKRRMAYETWYYLHLLGYAAVALALGHALVLGSDFVDNRFARMWWIGLYAAVAWLIVWSRLRPLVLSLLRPMRVTEVRHLPDGAMSIWVAGRSLPSMQANAGQFFSLRFAVRGLWWQTHPYSLSAEPYAQGLRFTFHVGDDVAAFHRIKVGTRLWLEGPYGRFTADQSSGRAVVAIAGGSGVAPIRALLADLTPDQRPEVIMRVSQRHNAWFVDEINALVAARNGHLHLVEGSRFSFRSDPLGAAALLAAVPDIADRDAYVCGPEGMTRAARKGLKGAGVRRIHTERYGF